MAVNSGTKYLSSDVSPQRKRGFTLAETIVYHIKISGVYDIARHRDVNQKVYIYWAEQTGLASFISFEVNVEC